jgi:hypothetical protein
MAKRAEQDEKVRNLRQLDTTKSLSIVRVDPSAVNSDKLSVWIPGQGTKTVTKVSPKGNANEWAGSLNAPSQGTITVVVRDGKVTGSINTPSAAYRIVSIGPDCAALVKLDEKKFPPD